MPRAIEAKLNRQIRNFMWNHEKVDTVNQAQMYTPHQKGGKKILDIEARNKAIHLTWLKAYLNLGEDRATWAYFADAIIGTDIPRSQNVDEDPESRLMPILQTWETRARSSTLPIDLQTMLKLARDYNVRIEAANPSTRVKEDMPLWYHTKSTPSARRMYKLKPAKCLRRNHGVKLVKDATSILTKAGEDHLPRQGCRCHFCDHSRRELKCKHPHKCLDALNVLLGMIIPKWNPTRQEEVDKTTHEEEEEDPEPEDLLVEKGNRTTSLREVIRIFGSPEDDHTHETDQLAKLAKTGNSVHQRRLHRERHCKRASRERGLVRR